ncbi:HPr(Ser) kinase/phosphatase [Caldichromatium japonicum]|uniref:HPr(Ser) kinase/phosphatase n=1 Tax=Caldichromatium japonicum TaxID=2699430 RepID=A0A6G7VAK2_9GAMM|nr:HPr(Ser) kinase/phosphatase [Caldichromatium japonicum]QIK36940.1 HPr(Ser) kinase/phosphatase [Caldichromatium japonicum]
MIDSLQSVVAQTSPQLKLRWLTPEPSTPRPLRGDDPEQSLIGSLNLIHPNRLQVVGPPEQRYLSGLGHSAYSEMLDKLFADRLAAIIFSDGITPTREFMERARASATPMLASPLGDQELINHLRYFLTQAFAERTTIHGVFIEVLGMGVLLTGASAVGKIELALDLIGRGHRLIADDAPCFARIAPEVIEGRCPGVLQDFLEVRGLGILNIRAMFGESAVLPNKPLNLIIDLQPLGHPQFANCLEGSLSAMTILGVRIPRVTMPVASGRNLAVLVEAAVRQQILRIRGYEASADLIERQARAIHQAHPEPLAQA